MTKTRTGKDNAQAQVPPAELTESELAKATGGTSLSYSAIKVTYKPQKPDGEA